MQPLKKDKLKLQKENLISQLNSLSRVHPDYQKQQLQT